MTYTESNPDQRNHLQSMLMWESLLDREVQKSTEPNPQEAPVVRMLPDAHVVKIGGKLIFIPKISAGELKERNLETLPLKQILIDLLRNSQLVDKFQIINGAVPKKLEVALNGEHVGTIIYADK